MKLSGLSACMASVLLCAAPVCAADPAWGPELGRPAPSFSLQDQNGAVRPLSSLLQDNGAILVFFRSADW